MITDKTTTSEKVKDPMVRENVVDIAPGAMGIITACGTLRTIVGSGVSVCLFNFPNRVAGMNHFLFPRTDDSRNATGRYGNAAMIGLLRMFEQTYPPVTPLAYIVGGAYCDEHEIDAAADNIRMAWKFLCVKRIPIIAQHIGGRNAREALFDVDTAEFTVKEIRDDDSR